MSAPTETRTIALVLEYEGTHYSGFQLQDNAPTIQGELESALLKMTDAPVRVRPASRTDAGVHARGQVVAFETSRASIPLKGFELGLNAILPPAIRVRGAELKPEGFAPRFEARGKFYRYTYWNDRLGTALDRDRAWHVPKLFDLSAMNEAASSFVGTHDFDGFRSSECPAPHAVRTIYQMSVKAGAYSRVELDVVGNAFCRNMVRIIAGTLRDVGIGRISAKDVPAILESRDRSRAGMTAPAHGLCLEEVIFDERLPARKK